jgi:hypothetical protein
MGPNAERAWAWASVQSAPTLQSATDLTATEGRRSHAGRFGQFQKRCIRGTSGRTDCYGPPASLECPEMLPNIGERCQSQGLQCNYPFEPGECPPRHTTVLCFRGEWEEGEPLGCPGEPSRAAVALAVVESFAAAP